MDATPEHNPRQPPGQTLEHIARQTPEQIPKQTPEQLRRQIETTKAKLGEDLDLLAAKVSPGRVAGRTVEGGKRAVFGLVGRVTAPVVGVQRRIVAGALLVKDGTGAVVAALRGVASQPRSHPR